MEVSKPVSIVIIVIVLVVVAVIGYTMFLKPKTQSKESMMEMYQKAGKMSGGKSVDQQYGQPGMGGSAGGSTMPAPPAGQ